MQGRKRGAARPFNNLEKAAEYYSLYYRYCIHPFQVQTRSGSAPLAGSASLQAVRLCQSPCPESTSEPVQTNPRTPRSQSPRNPDGSGLFFHGSLRNGPTADLTRFFSACRSAAAIGKRSVPTPPLPKIGRALCLSNTLTVMIFAKPSIYTVGYICQLTRVPEKPEKGMRGGRLSGKAGRRQKSPACPVHRFASQPTVQALLDCGCSP